MLHCNVAMKVANENKGIFSFYSYNMKKQISLRAISRVNVSIKIVSNQLKIHIINISNCTLYIVNFFNGFDSLFLADFGKFSERGCQFMGE